MQVFKFTVQAALWIYHLSAISLTALTARKRISPSVEDDKEALPPWPPQAFREKGLIKKQLQDLIFEDKFFLAHKR